MRFSMVAVMMIVAFSRSAVFAETFCAFQNGYVVAQLTEESCQKALRSFRVPKTQPIGGTSLWVPGLEDIQGVDLKSPDGETLVSVLMDPTSRVAETEYGTVVVSKDHKTLIVVYRRIGNK